MALKVATFVLAAIFLLSIAAEVSFATSPYTLPPPPKEKAYPPAPAPAPKPNITHVDVKECPKLCDFRCSKHSRPRHCHRVCQTCCERCTCVPPGTYGNREMCGTCYTDMTTHRNATKCP